MTRKLVRNASGVWIVSVVVALVGACAGVWPGSAVARGADPAQVPANPGATWKLTGFAASDGGIAGIACPSVHLCVAADDLGALWTTTHPTGARSAWRKVHVDGGNAFSWVSCPSVHLCVADDLNGNVLTSTDPSGGRSAWHRADIDGSRNLFDMSCPTASFCIVGDSAGRLLWSDDPAGGTFAWHSTLITRGDMFTAVSCATASLCVTADVSGNAAVSTDPSGGPPTWGLAGIDGDNALSGLSCPSRSLCVAVDAEAYSQGNSGRVLTSSQPFAGGRPWKTSFVDHGSNFAAVTCSSTTLCVAEDEDGNLLASTHPTRPESWITASSSSAVGSGGEISCVGRSLCATGATDGVLTTTSPAG
jgi:hypothetical protein